MSGNRFREALLDPNKFVVSWELVPGRGAKEKAQEKVLFLARQAAEEDKIHAITLTDNLGGTPAMSADFMAVNIAQMGISPVVHFTCKDRNRNQIESLLYALDRGGVENLLVMSGDYPVSGYKGRPAPVFDLDAIHILQFIAEMNRGLAYSVMKGVVRHQPSNFFPGAVVSPFKATEAELLAQYYKLKKKILAGAQFIVTQLGYDARKFHEVLLFMKQSGFQVPLIGNIYILSYGAAKMMNRNDLPGSIVTHTLLAELDEERKSPDKGEGAKILRAARMYALLKGMGYSGVHLGGYNIRYEDICEIISRGEALVPEWKNLIRYFDYPIPGGFYYFERDLETGLNKEIPVSRKNRPPETRVEWTYGFSRFVHHILLEPDKNLYGVAKRIAVKISGTRLGKIFHKLEHLTKVLIYDCKDCGDCALSDVAYLCPMSQCPKKQRNGACGGSFQGWCEVYPYQRQCIYVKAYARLKKYDEETRLETGIVPPCNWDLHQTSSWLNYYLGKDHASKNDRSLHEGSSL